MAVLWYIAAGLVGAVVTWLIVSARARSEIQAVTGRNGLLESSLTEAKAQAAQIQERVVELSGKLAGCQADLENEKRRMAEYSREVEGMRQRLQVEFENLANRILEEKTAKFTAQNQITLEQLLGPLKTQIGDFKSKVEQVYTNETADRRALQAQIQDLLRLNQEMTVDARNLTQALKGDSKVQGNWGELVLERVLENCGLTAGEEFVVQKSLRNEEGASLRPDVVVNLPENKHLVIDSKVSLTAYERYCSAADAREQEIELAAHVQSIRDHFQELAKKRYQDLYEIHAPEFVFMFIPIEPAFGCAVREDRELVAKAFEKKVILVTPTTLLVALWTVAHIWKQEKQSRNVLEIARRSGALYDKFVGFFEDMKSIGLKLEATREVYESAMNKLGQGRGNLIKSVEEVKKLGAKASKALPPNDVQDAIEADALMTAEPATEEMAKALL